MNILNFEEWLNKLGSIWERKSVEEAAELFSKVNKYYETPFDKPVSKRSDIVKLWEEVPECHDEISVFTKPILFSNNLGIANWNAKFKRLPSKKSVELDGIY